MPTGVDASADARIVWAKIEARSERIEGLLHRAAMQWSQAQNRPARQTLSHALALMEENDRDLGLR